MDESENLKDEIKKNIEFVSFSEVDDNGKLNEAYGYFRESTMAQMFEQYEEENEQKKK